MIRFISLAVLLCSCFFSQEKTRIALPVIDDSYYLKSIDILEEAIDEQPDYLPFIRLQINYYERLGWPEGSFDAIERAGAVLVNDLDFFKQRIAYYRQTEAFDDLISAIDSYPIEGEWPLNWQTAYLEGLVQLQDTAKFFATVEQLSDRNKELLDQQVLNGYLALRDTTRFVDLFLQNIIEKSAEEIQTALIPVLVAKGSWGSLVDLYHLFPAAFTDEASSFSIGRAYVGLDSLEKAVYVLQNDTTLQPQLLLAEVYQSQFKLLSATRVLDQLAGRYPEEKVLYSRRALLADKRGYYEAAKADYYKILTLDSLDQEAIDGLLRIDQKIAYLRRQREQRQVMPLMGLDTLKKRIQ
ncbi:MAG: tetratricopeptide (TPR) repeat protein [Paraglaciecola sp.]|jgi:tetratricopeptide (TPR) repeat protein